MGACKRFYGNARSAPESLRFRQPGGAPLVVEPGEEVRESKCPGMVAIVGAKQTRYAWAEPIPAKETEHATEAERLERHPDLPGPLDRGPGEGGGEAERPLAQRDDPPAPRRRPERRAKPQEVEAEAGQLTLF